MKFRVEHDTLADAVAWVARALPSRPVVPVLSGMRLDAGDGLTLSCFDYELSATAHLPADVVQAGTALVPGRLLAEITRSLPGQPAEFRSDGEEVTLACGSAEFALVSLPTAEYPALPPAPPLAGTIDGGELAAAVAQVLPAASRDDTLPMLTAVCLDIRGAVMTLAATDRYRLAVRDLDWQPGQPAGPGDRTGPGQDPGRCGPRHGARYAGVGGIQRTGSATGRGSPAGGGDDLVLQRWTAAHGPADRGGVHQVRVPVPGRVWLPGGAACRLRDRGGPAGVPGG